MLTTYFNSIKVRLEQPFAHIGRLLMPFQFHKGTIRTPEAIEPTELTPHFNSIKVRLERLLS